MESRGNIGTGLLQLDQPAATAPSRATDVRQLQPVKRFVTFTVFCICILIILFQTLCNCDASGDLKIDNGLLSAMDQLPVTQLNFGGGSNRFSWILYKLGFLECNGKAELAQYPSETIDNKIDAVIEDIADLTMTSEVHATSIKTLETTTSNQGASINHLQSDVAGLEEKANRDDCFFNYQLGS